jgi:UDP-N-acetylglucosamine acyltransferase
MIQIHPTAIVHPKAQLGPNVSIGAYCVIGEHVQIGAETTVGPHCVIEGLTAIGQRNHLFQFSSIGAAPQDKKYRDEPTRLEIGDDNTIREFCTINTGTVQDEGVTRIGNHNWIMAYVHIAHDVQIGDHTVLANNATFAGHVHVGDWATVGGLTGVHQFVKIGAHAMVGFQAHVAQDVPPYFTVDGNPLRARAVNLTGLKRRGFSDERLSAIRHMYKLIYRQGHTLDQAITELLQYQYNETSEAQADIASMIEFLQSAQRGIVR